MCPIIVTCSSQQGSHFEISPEIISNNEITLAEIADDIEYIPLDNSVPIGITYSMRITGDNIYISIKDTGIVQYDRKGKYIRKIAA